MTDNFKFTEKPGLVKSFNVKTGAGRVTVGKKSYAFDTTCFRVRALARYPRSGERVMAILSDNGKRLVSVWAVEGKA
jgi:hypothetical protein